MTTTRKGNSTKRGGRTKSVPDPAALRTRSTRNSNKNNINGGGDDSFDKENNTRSIVPYVKGKTKKHRQILSPSSWSNTIISPKKKKTKTSSLPVVVATISPVSYRTRGKLALLNRPPPLPIVPVVKAYFHFHYNENITSILTSNRLLQDVIYEGDEVGLMMLQLYWEETKHQGFGSLICRVDDMGRCALHYAAVAPNEVDTTSCLKILLKYNVDVNVQTKIGATPVSLASHKGKIGCLKVLLKAKADVSTSESGFPLIVAQNEAVVTMLVKAGASVNAKNSEGISALMFACHKRRIDVINRLLELEADVNIQCDGDTPLMSACSYGNEDVVRVLLAHKPDLEIKCPLGMTALMMSSIADNENIVCMLVSAGANVNARGLHGEVLHYAVHCNHDKIVSRLLKGGANPNQQNHNGFTPMHVVARRLDDNSRIVEWIKAKRIFDLLTSYGANGQLVGAGGIPSNHNYERVSRKVEAWKDQSAEVNNFLANLRTT